MPPSSLHFCTSASWGGLELYACTTMAALRDAGSRVTAVCAPRSRCEAFLRERGIPVIALPGTAKISLAAVRRVRALLDEERIDVVHVHVHRDIWNASLALRNDRSRRLIVGVYMGVAAKNDLLHRWIYRRVDALHTSSPEFHAKLARIFPVPASRIHLLRYGRALGRYVRDEAKRRAIRARHGINGDEIVAGTMVRIDPGKGVMDFARSYGYIDPRVRARMKFLIVGEPTRKAHARAGSSPYEEHCEAYLRDLEAYIAAEGFAGRIILAGFQDDLIGYLSAIDLFVFPSRDELYSLVMLDAMAMSLPVVAANAGGNRAQIEDGVSGLLYAVGDSRDAAAKIGQYAADPALRARHGAAARRFVERHHDMQDAVRELLLLYETPRVAGR